MRRRRPKIAAALAALALTAAACSSSGDGTTNPDDSTAAPATDVVERADSTDTPATDVAEPSDSTAAPDADAGEPSDSSDTTDADQEPMDLGVGVTDDTITIGYTYLDFDAIREQGIVDINHGPYEQHVQTMVGHINSQGGINGRDLEVIAIPIDPVDASSRQATCLELTEDKQVFAVLGAIRGDDVLCYTEQHDTIAIPNAGMTQERIERANAPYATINVDDPTKIAAFVADVVERGLLDDATVAVHSSDAAAVAADIAIPELQGAGIDVEFESLIQGDGSVGGAAAELSVNVEAMRAKGVDTVFVVGDALVAVNTFIGEGFFPTLFFTEQGSAAAAAARADLSAFPAVYTFGGFSDISRYQEPTFLAECAPVWDAAHPDDVVLDPNDVADGDSNHVVGLGNVCRALTVFVAVANATGPNLNNETFGAAMDTLGDFELPGYGSASLEAGKYGAQDNLILWTYDPENAESDNGLVQVEG
jgi:hypothetical protein